MSSSAAADALAQVHVWDIASWVRVLLYIKAFSRVRLNNLAAVIEDLRFAGVEHAACLSHHKPII